MSEGGPPVVEAWQVAALLITIAVPLLVAYGGLILRNRGAVNTLRQRLFGTSSDDTDDGFIPETKDRMDSLETKVDRHAQETHNQLYSVDRKLNVIIREVNGDIELDDEVGDVPPPGGRDFLRGGGGGGEPRSDGGRPEDED